MPVRLKRCLSLWEVVVYGVGLILGAGIYVLIGSAAGIAGNMIWLSFLVAAFVAGLTAVSYAELSTIFPKSGAEFIFAREAFGSDIIAWIVGFCAIIIGFSTTSTVALGFAQYAQLFIPGDVGSIALLLIMAMSLISFWGIEESARFNLISTSIELTGLFAIIVIGGYYICIDDIALAPLMDLPQLSQDTFSGIIPIVSAGALIFFAFIGFEDIVNMAEETEDPEKTIPKALIYSLLISTVIYVMVAIVAVSVVPFEQLAQSDQPLSEVMEHLIGGRATAIIALIALFATANTVLITLIVGARMLYGMAMNSSLPRALAWVHEKRQTPWVAVILMGIASIFFLAFEEIEVLASISDVGIFLLFFAVNLSNIFLRYRRPELNRAWKAPVNVGSFPVVSGLGAVSCLMILSTINHPVLMFEREFSSLIVGLIIFALAIPLYFLIGRYQKT